MVTTVRLTARRRQELLDVAEQEGVKPSELLRRAVDEFLARRSDEESAA